MLAFLNWVSRDHLSVGDVPEDDCAEEVEQDDREVEREEEGPLLGHADHSADPG